MPKAGTIVDRESCANCGAAIGRLETPCVWREQIVCAACRHKLELEMLRGHAEPEPRAARENRGSTPMPVQTIERTAKKWKLLMLIALAAAIGGFALAASAVPGAIGRGNLMRVPTFAAGMIVLLAGFALACYTQLMAWWHHG